ncbi:hypothetical protein J6590_006178 [Homalodisca vitripennis]|nr:hypothetical protein J6590_006178 [Homalodisca vitripennis]
MEVTIIQMRCSAVCNVGGGSRAHAAGRRTCAWNVEPRHSDDVIGISAPTAALGPAYLTPVRIQDLGLEEYWNKWSKTSGTERLSDTEEG